MAKSSRAATRGLCAFTPALLASTCAAALLLGAPAQAEQTVANQTLAAFSNVAGNVTTSILIDNTTVTGAVVNAGTITPGINLGASTWLAPARRSR